MPLLCNISSRALFGFGGLAIDAPPQRPAILSPLQTFQPLRLLKMTEELNKELIYSRMKIIYDAWAVCLTSFYLLWQLTSMY
jgi:hypothetical protein